MLGDLQRRLGVSYLFITHDIEIVRAIADRVVVMHQGRIVDQGDKADVLSPPFEDYTRSLLESVPEMAADWLDQRSPVFYSKMMLCGQLMTSFNRL